MYFVSYFLKVDVYCFLMLLHPVSIDIRVLTYTGLETNDGTVRAWKQLG